MEIVALVNFIGSEINTQDPLRILLEGYALNALNQSRQWNSLPNSRTNLCTKLSNWLRAWNNALECMVSSKMLSQQRKTFCLCCSFLDDSCKCSVEDPAFTYQ